MSLRPARLKAPNAAIEAESFADHFGSNPTGKQRINSEGVSFWYTFLYAPFDRKQSYRGIIAMALIMELVGTLVFSLFSNLARQAATGLSTLLDGAVLGIVMGGTYYMATGWRLHQEDEENELPRHLSWSVTLGYFLAQRTGFVVLLGYWFAQTIGALIAGGIMYGMGVGSGTLVGAVPTPVIGNLAITWGLEILGSAIIVFTLLYNHLLGGTYKKEDEHERHAQELTSYARALYVTVTYQYQVYSLDAVIYLGGLIGLCSQVSGCPNATPFHNAPVFYLLVPFIGTVIAGLVYGLLLCIYGTKRTVTTKTSKAGSSKASTPAANLERSTNVGDLISAKRN